MGLISYYEKNRSSTLAQTHSAPSTHAAQRAPAALLRSVLGFCGFAAVFGLAHLLLIDITKVSGYVFFGVVAGVPLVIAAVLVVLAGDRAAAFKRFGFGALMCVCAIPVIYLARVVPESSRQTVRNLLGLPFLALAVVGPEIVRSVRRQRTA
jgi:hypothetical protein